MNIEGQSVTWYWLPFSFKYKVLKNLITFLLLFLSFCGYSQLITFDCEIQKSTVQTNCNGCNNRPARVSFTGIHFRRNGISYKHISFPFNVLIKADKRVCITEVGGNQETFCIKASNTNYGSPIELFRALETCQSDILGNDTNVAENELTITDGVGLRTLTADDEDFRISTLGNDTSLYIDGTTGNIGIGLKNETPVNVIIGNDDADPTGNTATLLINESSDGLGQYKSNIVDGTISTNIESGGAVTSFDAFPTITGVDESDWFMGFRSRPNITYTGEMDSYNAFYDSPTFNNSVINGRFGFSVLSPLGAGGTLSTNIGYAFYPQTYSGILNNYGIYIYPQTSSSANLDIGMRIGDMGANGTGIFIDPQTAGRYGIEAGGLMKFTAYGGGTNTGTLTNYLGVDLDGDVIEVAASGVGNVSGTGTTNYVPKWTGANTLSSTSLIYDNGSGVSIGGTNPLEAFHVLGGDIRISDGRTIEWGNGATASVNIYGSTTTNDLTIQTNGANRVRVTSAGDVGIGTISPTNLLHVSGTGTVMTLESDNNSVFSNFVETTGISEFGAVNGGLIFRGLTGNSSFNKSGVNNRITVSDNTGTSDYAEVYGDLLALRDNAVRTVLFDADGDSYVNTGNDFGVGITTPLYKLDVLSDATVPFRMASTTGVSYMYMEESTGVNTWGANNGSFRFNPRSGTNYFNTSGVDNIVWVYDNTASNTYTRLRGNDFFIVDNGVNDIAFQRGGNSWINNGFNFGIGTSSPQYRLDVAGSGDVARFGDGTGATGVILEASNVGSAYLYFPDSDAANAADMEYSHGNDGFFFSFLDVPLFSMNGNGRMAIGKNAPDFNTVLDIVGQASKFDIKTDRGISVGSPVSAHYSIAGNTSIFGTGLVSESTINLATTTPDVDHTFRMSTDGTKMEYASVLAGVTQVADLFSLNADGSIKFSDYGIDENTGTLSRLLGVEADGDVIEVQPNTLLSGYGTDGYLPNFDSTNGLEDSPIYTDGTNIGIGTTLLSSTFTVKSTDGSSGFSLLNSSNFPAVSFVLNGVGRGQIEVEDGSGATKAYIYGNGEHHLYDVGQNLDVKLTPNSSSYFINNLGVGTDSPTEKLDVNGQLRVRSIPTYANTAAAAADGTLLSGEMFKVDNGDGTSALHIKN